MSSAAPAEPPTADSRWLRQWNIPVEPGVDAQLLLPWPMTEANWQQFWLVLDAMKPGLVRDVPVVVAGGGGTENASELEAFRDGYVAGAAAPKPDIRLPSPCGVPHCGILGPHEHTIYGGGGTENGSQPCHGSTCLSGPGLHARTGSCVSGAADGGDT